MIKINDVRINESVIAGYKKTTPTQINLSLTTPQNAGLSFFNFKTAAETDAVIAKLDAKFAVVKMTETNVPTPAAVPTNVATLTGAETNVPTNNEGGNK